MQYSIAGVKFKRASNYQTKEIIKKYLNERKGHTVFTPNTLILSKCNKDTSLASLLNSADLLLPDGMGISLICKKRGFKCERITGIDTAEWVLEYAARNGLSIFLLGGKAGIAERAAARLMQRLSGLKIAGTHHGYFDKTPSSEQNKSVAAQIQDSRADIVFVCFGFPTQEEWIIQNKEQFSNVRLFMGLGGSLDVWSGKVCRAPRPFRAAGLEWLWRCMCEPRRIGEILSLPIFLLKNK